MTQKTQIDDWRDGAAHFNEGRYWHAHESWERGWLKLEPRSRLYIQALIQVAGLLHLLEKGRGDPARRLARAALEKLKLCRRDREFEAVMEIQGSPVKLDDFLQAVLRGENAKTRLQVVFLGK